MPNWDVEWTAKGTATVEADDADEAEAVLSEAITNFETFLLEKVEVTEVECVDTEPESDD